VSASLHLRLIGLHYRRDTSTRMKMQGNPSVYSVLLSAPPESGWDLTVHQKIKRSSQSSNKILMVLGNA